MFIQTDPWMHAHCATTGTSYAKAGLKRFKVSPRMDGRS